MKFRKENERLKIERLFGTHNLEGKVAGTHVKLLGIAVLNTEDMNALEGGPGNDDYTTCKSGYKWHVIHNEDIPKKQDGSLPDLYYQISPLKRGYNKKGDMGYDSTCFRAVAFFEKID